MTQIRTNVLELVKPIFWIQSIIAQAIFQAITQVIPFERSSFIKLSDARFQYKFIWIFFNKLK